MHITFRVGDAVNQNERHQDKSKKLKDRDRSNCDTIDVLLSDFNFNETLSFENECFVNTR